MNLFLWLIVISVAFLACVTLFVLATRMVAIRRASKRKRGLFRFHDGARIREVDPIAVLMTLEEHPQFRIDVDPRRAIIDGDRQAMAVMADAVRSAFSVPEYSRPGAPGLTTHELVELLSVFISYVDLQKKNSKSRQTLPQSTAPTSSESEKPITPDTSDSGFADSAPVQSSR